MKKKPISWYQNKWVLSVGMPVIIIPLGVAIWTNLRNLWAAPDKIQTIEQAVVQQSNISRDLKEVVDQERNKNSLQDQEIKYAKDLTQEQINTLKELVLQMKKK